MIMRTCAHICASTAPHWNWPESARIRRILREAESTGIQTVFPLAFSVKMPAPDYQLCSPQLQGGQVQNLLELGEVLTSQGITSICDMGNLGPGDNFPVYEAAVLKGFRQKTGIYYMWDYFADDPDFSISAEKLDRRRQIFAAGLKLIGDGSVSGRTAWMDRPYLGSCSDVGLPVCSDELLESAIRFCRQNRC